MPRHSSGPGSEAYATALRLLTGRDYSVSRLRRKLGQRGFPEELIDQAVVRCQELGYLDDQRYARARARSLLNQGRATGRCLLMDLRRQGLSEQLAEQTVLEAMQDFDQEDLLIDVLRQRFPNFSYQAASVKERRRIVQFLQRRGFPLDQIMTILTRKGL